MSIATGQIVTWSELTASVLSALKAVCCNIGQISSNVPARMRSGSGAVVVKSFTTGQGGSLGAGHPNIWSSQQLKFYASPSNLISAVADSTITNSSGTGEWDTFLAAANVNSRSNKIIQAKDFGLAIGLFQQFMSYHLKPVYARLEVYATLETTSTFKGTKYLDNAALGGACSPKYTLSDPGANLNVTNADIQTITRQNIINENINWGVFSSYENPKPFKAVLTGQ